jgi:hypothetical protein
MPDFKEIAEFSVQIPGGGHFRASWPRSISTTGLRMGRDMLNLTLDWWIEKGREAKDAEAEYASWSIACGVTTPDQQPK